MWNFEEDIIPFIEQARDKVDKERRRLSYECMRLWVNHAVPGKVCPPDLALFISDEILAWTHHEIEIDEGKNGIDAFYESIMHHMARYNYTKELEVEWVRALFACYSALLPFGIVLTPFDVNVNHAIRQERDLPEGKTFGYCIDYQGIKSKLLFVPKGKSWSEIGDEFHIIEGG